MFSVVWVTNANEQQIYNKLIHDSPAIRHKNYSNIWIRINKIYQIGISQRHAFSVMNKCCSQYTILQKLINSGLPFTKNIVFVGNLPAWAIHWDEELAWFVRPMVDHKSLWSAIPALPLLYRPLIWCSGVGKRLHHEPRQSFSCRAMSERWIATVLHEPIYTIF